MTRHWALLKQPGSELVSLIRRCVYPTHESLPWVVVARDMALMDAHQIVDMLEAFNGREST